MPNPQKRKGNAYENEIRKKLVTDGICVDAVRNTQYDQRQKGAADVVGTLPNRARLHVECKRPGAKATPKLILRAIEGADSIFTEDGYALVTWHAFVALSRAEFWGPQEPSCKSPAYLRSALAQAEESAMGGLLNEPDLWHVPVAIFRKHGTSLDFVFMSWESFCRIGWRSDA